MLAAWALLPPVVADLSATVGLTGVILEAANAGVGRAFFQTVDASGITNFYDTFAVNNEVSNAQKDYSNCMNLAMAKRRFL